MVPAKGGVQGGIRAVCSTRKRTDAAAASARAARREANPEKRAITAPPGMAETRRTVNRNNNPVQIRISTGRASRRDERSEAGRISPKSRTDRGAEATRAARETARGPAAPGGR